MLKIPEREKFGRKPLDVMLLFLQYILDYMVRIYIILIIGVLPFYNTRGYGHIGSDKADFFIRVSVNMGKVLVPVLAVYLAARAVKYFRRMKSREEGSCPNRSHPEGGRLDGSYSDGNQLKRSYSEGSCPGPEGDPGKLRMLWTAIRKKMSVTDIFAAVYGISVILSFLCSSYKPYSFWGTERWYMGFCTQMILLAVYFLVSRVWKPGKILFCLMFPISAAVFLLGYLNRFEIRPLEMEYASPAFISTIGNLNWYCGYTVSVLFAGVALLWLGAAAKGWQKILLGGYVILGFGTLVTQGSDSGVFALAVVVIVLFCLSVPDEEKMQGFWRGMLMLSAACMITYIIQKTGLAVLNYEADFMNILLSEWLLFPMTAASVFFMVLGRRDKKRGIYRKRLFRGLAVTAVAGVSLMILVILALAAVNTKYPGSIGALSEYPMFTFSNEWASNRGATWKAGWMCFMEQGLFHKLVGTGPDAMWPYIVKDGSQELYSLVVDNFGNNNSLANAHNEWLTVLVDTGILGLAGFGGMMTAAVVEFVKNAGKNPFVCACGICVLAYTVNNIFSFQQAMSASTIFVIMGMGRAFERQDEQEETEVSGRKEGE